MKILIAEDDMNSRRFISKYLSQYGECELAVDGMEALEAYLEAEKANQPFDAIFLDVMMPKVDGLKVLKAIRDFEVQRNLPEEKRVKIIMLTALADVEYVNQAFELGCAVYAAKPLDVSKLEDAMKQIGLL